MPSQAAELRSLTPGQLLAGKYRLEQMLGSGAMGAVYEATNVLTERTVALKWMLAEAARTESARSRLLQEARAAGRIDHPNVVSVFDVGEHDGAPFLVMERLRGQSLRQRLAWGLLSPLETLEILLQAAHGVAAAQALGVIHRDLKPDNLFLTRDQHGELCVKVLDFGISKLAEPIAPSLTRSGAVLGTPFYMAPETLRAEPASPSSDVYALGVIAYECLAGRPPFVGGSYAELVVAVATAAPIPLRELRQLSPSLEDVIARAMARDRAVRIPSASQLAEALRRIQPSLDPTRLGRRLDVDASADLGPRSIPAGSGVQADQTCDSALPETIGASPVAAPGARLGVPQAPGGMLDEPAAGRSHAKRVLVLFALLCVLGLAAAFILHRGLFHSDATSSPQARTPAETAPAAAPQAPPLRKSHEAAVSAPAAQSPLGSPVVAPQVPSEPRGEITRPAPRSKRGRAPRPDDPQGQRSPAETRATKRATDTSTRKREAPENGEFSDDPAPRAATKSGADVRIDDF